MPINVNSIISISYLCNVFGNGKIFPFARAITRQISDCCSHVERPKRQILPRNIMAAGTGCGDMPARRGACRLEKANPASGRICIKRPPSGGLLRIVGRGEKFLRWRARASRRLLSLHADYGFQHGVNCGNALGVGLESALGGDHVHELAAHVHIGSFYVIGAGYAEAIVACHSLAGFS